jgi:hypothetical protein
MACYSNHEQLSDMTVLAFRTHEGSLRTGYNQSLFLGFTPL